MPGFMLLIICSSRRFLTSRSSLCRRYDNLRYFPVCAEQDTHYTDAILTSEAQPLSSFIQTCSGALLTDRQHMQTELALLLEHGVRPRYRPRPNHR